MNTIKGDAMASMAGRWQVGDDRNRADRQQASERTRPALDGWNSEACLARDLSLLDAVGQGDRSALEALYRHHGSAVYGYLLRQLGGDAQRAEEALQDVMLAVWKGAAAFRGESRVRTWLLAIAHRIALQDRRRKRGHLLSLDAETPPSSGADARDEAERRLSGAELRALMLRLPADLRSVLHLTLYQGLSTTEAGEVLGLPAGTIKSRLFRARKLLRAALDEEWAR